MAEESFEVRVKRLFGSNLFSSVPDNSFPSSSWSVAGGEVERQQWNRDGGAGPDRSYDPCASAFDDKDACFNNRSRPSSSAAASGSSKKEFEKDLGDDEGDGEDEAKEIRSFIGLDPTLDREEEEDEYDRAAFHKEKAGDRVYMRDINDVGPYIGCHTVLEDPEDNTIEEIHCQPRDPRADHFAASVRLKEDTRAAGSCYPTSTHSARDTDTIQRKFSNSDANLKPILKKREEAQHDPKTRKRVRFDAGFKEENEEGVHEAIQDSHMIPQSEESNVTAQESNAQQHLPKPEESCSVPDYIRNPSKYTCNTFDSSDNDDEANNKCAFEDFQKLVRKSNPRQQLLDARVELPKFVTFTPRRKAGDAISMDDNMGEDKQLSDSATRIAAGEMCDNEADEMEEDEVSPIETRISSRKEVRQYRSKSSSSDAT